jgi:beta-xylosidase
MPARAWIVALAAALLLAACGSSGRSSGETSSGSSAAVAGAASGTYTNPVYNGDFPDPAVLRVGATYHAYATQGAGKNIQTLTSPDLVHWRAGPDALPDLGPWADAGATWAPEVLAIGGTYVMYYVAHASKEGVQCIGRATATDPAGPFTGRSPRPLVCQAALGGSIDPNPVRAANGSLYLYWKNDGNCCAKPVHLWGQRLSPDGATLVGAPTALMTNTKAWQGNLVEAPEMIPHAGGYTLFYSANNYASTAYGIGYASCRAPLGPCTDRSDAPLVASNIVAAGPGHCFVVTTLRGRTEMLFHAWPPSAIGSTSPGRQLWLEPLTWKGAVPSVHPPQAASQPLPH